MAIILRRDKGFALTFDELDDNFAQLSGGSSLIIANTAPLEPSDGQMWLDTGITQRTFAWSVEAGGVWLDISPSNKTTISETEPLVKNIGDGWFDTSAGGVGSLVLWNGTSWVEVIGTGGNNDVAIATVQEITASGTIALDKTTGGAWVRFHGATGSGGGAGLYRSNNENFYAVASRSGAAGEAVFYVSDVSTLQGTSVTLGAGGAAHLFGVSNGSAGTDSGTEGTTSSWTLGSGAIDITPGTAGGSGVITARSNGYPTPANGTDGTVTNTSGITLDPSYSGMASVYEDNATNYLIGTSRFIEQGGGQTSGGVGLATASSESAAAIVVASPAGWNGAIYIVYDN